MPYGDPEKQREYQRAWVAERRRHFFADKSCAVCGSSDRMELDHIDPALKISHRIWSWSPARRAAEVEKCQVLCHAHHLEKTLSVYPAREHGTVVMYENGGCRCAECRAASASRRRAYRAQARRQTKGV